MSEFLVFVRNRSSNVRVLFHDPSSHKEIGQATISPSNLPMPHLSTFWLELNPTSRVLVHAYWSALLPSQKFSDKPEELGDSAFTLLLDRPQYLPGETVAGVVIYRAGDGHETGRKPKPLKSINLQIAGWSRQDSDGDYFDVARHIFFNHEAVLVGHQNSASLPVQNQYYIWTFNFPLPYSLPPSGLSCGNFYFLHAREVDPNGKTSKSARLYFGVRRVVFPREILAAAMDAQVNKLVTNPDGTTSEVPTMVPATTPDLPAGGSIITPAALPPSNSNKISAAMKPLTFVEVFDDPALADVKNSPQLNKILDEEDSDSDREQVSKRRRKHTKRSAKRQGKADAHVNAAHDDDFSDSLDSSSDSDSDGYENPRTRGTHKFEKGKYHEGVAGPTMMPGETAAVPREPMIAKTDLAAAPVAISEGETTDAMLVQTKVEQIPGATLPDASASGSAKSGEKVTPVASQSGAAAANAKRDIGTVAVPLRVNPTLTMVPQPSSGRKQLIVPVEITNTTSKPLQYFVVSLNYIIERSYRYLSTSGSHLKEFSHYARYHVKKFRFKKEAGWPLAPDATWSGTVTLFMPEDVPPSVDRSNSPLFSRNYYVKIEAVRHRHFSRQRIAKRIFLLLGDYDYNTRPLPVQHAHDTPIRFTIFTLPCGAAAPTFGPMALTAAPYPGPTLYNAEQSQVVHLEA